MKYIRFAPCIDQKVLQEIGATALLMDNLIDELCEIVDKDKDYTQLLESAKTAWAGLSDFLNEYKDLRH